MILTPLTNREHAKLAVLWTSMRLPIEWWEPGDKQWLDWIYDGEPDDTFELHKLNEYIEGLRMRLKK